MPDNSKDSTLRRLLEETSTIAMVGASTNPVSASLFVATYFSGRGRRVIPINPTRAGETLLGETILASIRDIPSSVGIDMLDVFRRSDAVPGIVDDALAHLMPGLKAVWMQYGVRHEAAAA
ncbi:MAG: CoA-binding protein, partial [Boseongicola sp.]|nr:CoA-binding protein [Boseongicola sp.]